MNKSVNSSRLERWLGAEPLEEIGTMMKGWHGPPIALAGVPGAVYCGRDGDFCGDLRVGWEATIQDCARDFAYRLRRAHKISVRNSYSQMNMGFASLAELVTRSRTYGRAEYNFRKNPSTGVPGVSSDTWAVATFPAAGSAASAAPGGRVPVGGTNGGFTIQNAPSGMTQHIVGATMLNNSASTIMLVDRIFDVTKTMNSTATESVTGVPTRYQSSTPTDMDYAGGNFLEILVRTALPATAHNWTVCLYRNQAGTDAQTLPSIAGASSAIVDRFDMPTGSWFCPLATGDTGVMDLNQMQCSAAVASGAIDFVINHPIAVFPMAVGTIVWQYEYIHTALNLARIFDNACLNFIHPIRPATTSHTVTGSFYTVAG